MSKGSHFKIDALASAPIRRLLRWSLFPVLFQSLLLALLLLLVVNGWGVGLEHEPLELLTLRKTNLTTLLVWGLWWPAMIALALLFGRAWCTVCPLELLSRAAHSIARRFGLPQARLVHWLRAGWMTLVFYLILQMLVSGVSLHRVPHLTGLMVLGLLGLALVSGLLFRHPRAFCRSFCPAAPLLSVYGRYTSLQLDRREDEVCDRCTTRDCASSETRHRFDERGCPSMLAPYGRSQSDGCVLCFQCAKACPHDNVGFGLAKVEAPTRRQRLLRPVEAAFVVVASGFVAHEVIGEVRWLDRFFHAVPEALHGWVSSIPFRWWEGFWFLVLFPVSVWAVVLAGGLLLGHREGLKRLVLVTATAAAPIIAISHLAKALAKISSWGGYLPLSMRDPNGVATFDRYASGILEAPMRLIELSSIGWLMLVLAILVAVRTSRWIRRVVPERPGIAVVGLSVVSLVYIPVLLAWALS